MLITRVCMKSSHCVFFFKLFKQGGSIYKICFSAVLRATYRQHRNIHTLKYITDLRVASLKLFNESVSTTEAGRLFQIVTL